MGKGSVINVGDSGARIQVVQFTTNNTGKLVGLPKTAKNAIAILNPTEGDTSSTVENNCSGICIFMPDTGLCAYDYRTANNFMTVRIGIGPIWSLENGELTYRTGGNSGSGHFAGARTYNLILW